MDETASRLPGALVGCSLLHLPDLDRVDTGMVPGAHVMVVLRDSARCGQVAAPVHVICAPVGVLVQPDAKVLDAQRELLKHCPQYTFIFLSCDMKYQKSNLATAWLVAKICMQ